MVRERPWFRRPLALVLLVGAVLLSAVALTRDPETADAKAMVVARQLDMSLSALPRYAETVFGNGVVEQAVREQLGEVGADGAYKDLIPDAVSLTVPDDGILLEVVGHSEDAQTAIDLANGAADAFVAELNTPGAGVGAFSVQAYAETASTPESGVAGLLLSLVLAAGLAVAGLLLLRQPRPART